MKLPDKVALITGGGRGIGKAAALACARKGPKAALCARTRFELEQNVGETRGLKTQAVAWPCDVSLEAAVNQPFEIVQKLFAEIHALLFLPHSQS